MKFKSTLILACGLAALAGYYFFMELPAETKRFEAMEQASKVLPFDPAKIQGIRLKHKDQTLEVSRQKDDWTMDAPVKTLADSDAIRGFLSRLDAIKYSRIVEEAADDLSAFGLDAPSLTIELERSDADALVLRVGDDAPMNNGLYLSTGTPQVYLARVGREELAKTAFDLRDKTPLRFEVDSITAVTLEREGEVVNLVKQGEDWLLKQEATLKADPGEVQNYLNHVRFLKIKSFVEEAPSDLQAYGLKTPYLRLALRAGKDGTPLYFDLGKEDGASGRHARTSDADRVFRISQADAGRMTRHAASFLDKTLFRGKIETTSRIEIQSGDDAILLSRDAENKSPWRIESPIQSGADPTTLNSLLADLREARVHEFLQTLENDPALYGLNAPEKRLKVQIENKEWSLALGRADGQGAFYAQREGEDAVFTLSKDWVEKLFRSLYSLRDKKIVHFETDKVSRIQIEYPDSAFEMERSGDEWNLKQPEVLSNIKAFLGNEVLWTLKTMEFESVSETKAEDALFEKPAARIALWGANGEMVETLLLAKSDLPERMLAKVESEPGLRFELKKMYFDELPRDGKKFRNQ
ncbi:MAG: DUF4340 domain-containing protein [Candidatus Nitrohelix vancouverensis]|uniref:DUF4340 domain-containing protein n=1 Tax=Candidatus Nitrohelix vancouverensis TaxID=2705534 RepID=A0A7T0G397_9BACT|nr:MAG: DUF4340 domain-containing protein [Candidatus Nitrohelix vancouverensis]